FLSLLFLIDFILLYSNLFPYTTLFRSARQCDRLAELVERGAFGTHELVRLDEGAAVVREHVGRALVQVRVDVGLRRADQHGAAVDRKSTRLNSSHVKNSYAVFCLKKKK